MGPEEHSPLLRCAEKDASANFLPYNAAVAQLGLQIYLKYPHLTKIVGSVRSRRLFGERASQEGNFVCSTGQLYGGYGYLKNQIV